MPVTTTPGDDDSDGGSRGRSLFAQAAAVAATGHFDYAIELYLQGLSINPDHVEAHRALRELSLRRKASGGRDLDHFAKLKLARAHESESAVLIAEKLLAYDPCNIGRVHDLLRAARAAALPATAAWVEDVLKN